jgi:DNA-binding CsgD family transcriptional regulator
MPLEKENKTALKVWLLATQHAPINKDINSLIKQMAPGLNLLSDTQIAAFIYNYEKGGYDYLNEHFVKVMNEEREAIIEKGIKIMQEKVHKDDFPKCLNITQKAFSEYLKMKPKEKETVHFRFFFRMKKGIGDYAWFMQTLKHFSNGENEIPMEVGYLIELFDPQHPLRVMGVLETNSRRIDVFPDGIDDLISKLTAREFEILQLARQGVKTKKIAVKLKLTENTIKTHRRNLLKKLEVSSVMQAVGLMEADTPLS